MAKKSKSIKRALGYLKNPTSDREKEFLEEAHKRFQTASEAEKDQREHELKCLEMCDPAQQWDSTVKAERDAEERPCMTEDRINPMVAVVCNGLMQNRASVQVNPVDDNSDPETAEAIQGLIRHLTYESGATMAYDTAATSMVRTGRGYYRIITEYENDESFDQVIRVKSVPNHHMVYMDPNSVEADYSDADWAMIAEDMDLYSFKRMYPDAQSSALSSSQWTSIGDDVPNWYSEEMVRVCEYFYKEPRKVKIVRLSNGQVLTSDKLPEGVSLKEGAIIFPSLIEAEQLYIDAIRDTITYDIKWAKITGIEVLERADWPGKYIPIVPVLGKELIINNKRRFYGLVSGMIDPQKRFNWLLSAQLEAINLVPKAPWIAPEGSLVNPTAWANAHRRPVGVLYHKREVDGIPVNTPQRVSASVDISSVNSALMHAADGLKGTSGLYNPSMGASEGGQSGVAIRAQQAQGDMSTAHFIEGVTRARRLEGKIYLDLIGKVYDTERVLRIINDDDTADQIKINEELAGEGGRKLDLTIGKYDLTVSAGPSYSTRRQENLAVLMNMAQTLPMIGQVAPDLIASQIDVPISKALTKRLKAALPPQLTQDENKNSQNGEGQEGPNMNQLMASYNEARSIMQEMAGEMQKLQGLLTDKQADRNLTIQVAKINAKASIERALVAKVPATAPRILHEYDEFTENQEENTEDNMKYMAPTSYEMENQDSGENINNANYINNGASDLNAGNGAGMSEEESIDAGYGAGMEQ